MTEYIECQLRGLLSHRLIYRTWASVPDIFVIRTSGLFPKHRDVEFQIGESVTDDIIFAINSSSKLLAPLPQMEAKSEIIHSPNWDVRSTEETVCFPE